MKKREWNDIRDTFNYKGLRQEIKKSGKKIPEWLEEGGFSSYRTQLRYNALSIIKLRDVMKALEMPVPYFFTEYQELLAELAFLRYQIEEIEKEVNKLPDSSGKTKLLNIINQSKE